ncbi:MAG TPA: MFS transporter, partial [Dehalococcoidia bacterium]|nr:MFS transporter [Dehalococcoidia bacterium]
KLLIGTQSGLALQATVLAVLTSTGLITISLIYVLAVLQGVANALDNPARQAFVMEMVGPDDVPNAVALNSSIMQMTRLVGPALAGITIASLGTALCFYLNAISFIAVLIGLILMDPSKFFDIERPKRAPALKQVGEGLRYALETPDILLAVITMAILGTFGYNFQVFVPLIAQFVLHTNSVGFGFLTSALGVGSLTAAFGVAWLGQASRRTLLIGAGCFSTVLFLVGLANVWVLVVPLLAMLGFSSTVFTSTNSARLQLIAPPHLRGRVMSINTLLFQGSTPIGSVIVGSLADSIGVQATDASMGVLCLLGVAISLLYVRRNRGRLVPPGEEFNRRKTIPVPEAAPAGASEGELIAAPRA